MSCRKKNRVATEVILQRMGQLAAERRRDEGRPPVRDAWAPVLAESVTDLHDVRVECGEPVWRATAMVRLACTAGKQAVEIKILQEEKDAMGAEMKRLQEEHDAMGAEMKRLQEENDDLRLQALRTITTIVVKDLQEKELCAPLCCPISMQLFKDPVVSIYGHSFERHDIEKWLVEHQCRCPLTNQHMTIEDLAPNYALAGVVDAFRAHQAE